jgi:hypothetical protein
MRVRKYDFGSITEFPELTVELPELLSSLGAVVQSRRDLTDSCINVTLRMHRPTRVWNSITTRPQGVVAVDPGTLRCAGILVPMRLEQPPVAGDTALQFVVQLELDSRNVPIAEHSAEKVRDLIRDFARKAAKGWYYPQQTAKERNP